MILCRSGFLFFPIYGRGIIGCVWLFFLGGGGCGGGTQVVRF
ncbi:uncharacterized protein J3R85_004036 [Psidium guajava]|nr:uncharacterized protein J3R85_004036 [Psidium guajava]